MSDSFNAILASNSPRRRHLLKLTGWDFNVAPADVNEDVLRGETPQNYVRRVAADKANKVHALFPEAVVLAADTTVAFEEQILGKPTSRNNAKEVLQSLRGRTHQVYTAIALIVPGNDQVHTDLASTDVPMRHYSDTEIESYLDTGDPFDKAGSYAIQHPQFRPVDRLDGCYANVVGLPLCHLKRNLIQRGLPCNHELALACQQDLNFNCSVSQAVLEGQL